MVLVRMCRSEMWFRLTFAMCQVIVLFLSLSVFPLGKFVWEEV